MASCIITEGIIRRLYGPGRSWAEGRKKVRKEDVEGLHLASEAIWSGSMASRARASAVIRSICGRYNLICEVYCQFTFMQNGGTSLLHAMDFFGLFLICAW